MHHHSGDSVHPPGSRSHTAHVGVRAGLDRIMSTRVTYWLPAQGQGPDDAFQCDSEAWDLQDAAEEAADDYHSNHDGWENSWPLTICVEQDGKTGQFIVDREARPHFTATEDL